MGSLKQNERRHNKKALKQFRLYDEIEYSNNSCSLVFRRNQWSSFEVNNFSLVPSTPLIFRSLFLYSLSSSLWRLFMLLFMFLIIIYFFATISSDSLLKYTHPSATVSHYVIWGFLLIVIPSPLNKKVISYPSFVCKKYTRRSETMLVLEKMWSNNR